MKKKLLIFDLDGTIADTIYSIRDAVNLTMRKYGFPERTYEQTRDAIGNGARELIYLSMPDDKRGDSELIDRVLADYDVFGTALFFEPLSDFASGFACFYYF